MPESRKRSTKPPSKPTKDPYRFRPCRLCKAKFKPTTHVVSCADSQEFCCPNHRKEYWKYGGLPFDKLMARIEKRCREIAREVFESGMINAPVSSMRAIAQEEIAAAIVHMQLDPTFLRLRTEPRPAVFPSTPQSA